MTIIIIAHRLSTLDSCDRLMVIYDGELKAFDTPDNLEKDNDFYREALELFAIALTVVGALNAEADAVGIRPDPISNGRWYGPNASFLRKGRTRT